MVAGPRLELGTYGLCSRRSNQLSYPAVIDAFTACKANRPHKASRPYKERRTTLSRRGACANSVVIRRLGEDARDVTHLAARADFELAIEMQAEVRLGEDVAPVLSVLADQIVHFDPAAPHCRAKRPAGDSADMLLELRGLRALKRPVAGIVDARRDLVDHERFAAVMVAGDEHLDRKHADIIERFEHRRADPLGLGRRLRADARGRAGAGEDVALVLVLAEVVGRELAFQAARRDHRHLALKGDEALEDHRRRAQRATK